MILVDTSVWVDHLHSGDPEPLVRLPVAAPSPGAYATPSPTSGSPAASPAAGATASSAARPAPARAVAVRRLAATGMSFLPAVLGTVWFSVQSRSAAARVARRSFDAAAAGHYGWRGPA